MPRRKPKHDPRLIGTWQADPQRTLADFVPPRGASPKKLRLLKQSLTTMTLRFDNGEFIAEADGGRSAGQYEVLACDSESVAIWYFDEFVNEYRVRQIHFEGEYFWVSLGRMREFFRRIS